MYFRFSRIFPDDLSKEYCINITRIPLKGSCILDMGFKEMPLGNYSEICWEEVRIEELSVLSRDYQSSIAGYISRRDISDIIPKLSTDEHLQEFMEIIAATSTAGGYFSSPYDSNDKDCYAISERMKSKLFNMLIPLHRDTDDLLYFTGLDFARKNLSALDPLYGNGVLGKLAFGPDEDDIQSISFWLLESEYMNGFRMDDDMYMKLGMKAGFIRRESENG